MQRMTAFPSATGRNYIGGTDEHAYVALMAHYGVKVYPVDDTPENLVVLAHRHIMAGHPVIITEPDPYMPLGSGWTHVIVLYEENPGGVTAMDPYIAGLVEFTDAGLAAHMAVREVWIAEKIGENEIVSISLNTAGVSHWFKPGVGNAWVCKQTGFVVANGMLNFYRTMGGSLAGLTEAGLPTSNERKPNKPPAMSANQFDQIMLHHPEIVEQDFERLTLRYDPSHALDNPPGASSVYVIHQVQVDTTGLQSQLDAARAQASDWHERLQNIETMAKV